MKITLKTAILVDGSSTYELTVKVPNFGNMVDMQSPISYKNPDNTKETLWRPRSEAEQSLVLIASLANITEKEARQLSIEDVTKIMEELAPFLVGPASA